MNAFLPRTYMVALAMGGLLALLAIAAGAPADAVLFAGLLVLVLRRRIFVFSMLTLASFLTWLSRARFPGQRALVKATLAVQRVPWTTAALDRQRRQREQLAEQERQQAHYLRYKDATYSEAEADAFFAAHSEPTVFLVRERPDHRRSRSQLGGLPALPDGLHWPEIGGEALHFVASLDLEEIPRPPSSGLLPEAGTLFFFAGLADRWRPRVLYSAQPGRQKTRIPQTLPAVSTSLQRGLRDVGQTDLRLLPEFGLRAVVAPAPTTPDRLPADVDYKLVNQASRQADAAFHAAHDGTETSVCRSGYHHHMTGGPKSYAPNPTQGTGVKLLQIDTDYDAGLVWGDVGKLEFWIDPDDLRARRFEAAELHVSSG